MLHPARTSWVVVPLLVSAKWCDGLLEVFSASIPFYDWIMQSTCDLLLFLNRKGFAGLMNEWMDIFGGFHFDFFFTHTRCTGGFFWATISTSLALAWLEDRWIASLLLIGMELISSLGGVLLHLYVSFFPSARCLMGDWMAFLKMCGWSVSHYTSENFFSIWVAWLSLISWDETWWYESSWVELIAR